MIHSDCMRTCFLQGADTYVGVAFALAVRPSPAPVSYTHLTLPTTPYV